MNPFARGIYKTIHFGCKFLRPNYAFVTPGQVDQLVENLVDRIGDSTFHPEIIVSIMSGGHYAGQKVAGALGLPMGKIFIRHYSIEVMGINLVYFPVVVPVLRRIGRMGKAELTSGLDKDVRSKRVLLLDDDIEHGETLRLAREILQKEGAAEVKTAVLGPSNHTERADFVPSNPEDVSLDVQRKMVRYGSKFRFKWPWEPISPHHRDV